MKKVFSIIKDKKIFKTGDTIGVAVSGGLDSMGMLHFLNENKEFWDIEVVAINVDHCIREKSSQDSFFVQDFCRNNHIRCHRFRVDALKIAREKNMGVEEAAREARYGVFDALIKKGIVDKICIAHHLIDQAETIILNIFRGAGLSGAGGMDYIRGQYVRPFLDLSKEEIAAYAYKNMVPHVEDESNHDSVYNRNFLRNEIFPKLRQRWPGIDQNIVSFGKSCKQDDKYIMSQATTDAIIVEANLVKIPLNYFIYHPSVTYRIISYALQKIGAYYDIERKHIELIKNLANAANGKKLDLPNGLTAIKEYEYISITQKEKQVIAEQYKFGTGKFNFADIFEISTRRTKKLNLENDVQLIDCKKLPKTAVWRVREKGDSFEKFGGGTKPLRAYLIDKKVPARLRDKLPVLADENEVYVILGVEISDKVKIDHETTFAYAISHKSLQK